MEKQDFLLRTDLGWPQGLMRLLDAGVALVSALLAGAYYLQPGLVFDGQYLQVILIGTLLVPLVFSRFRLYYAAHTTSLFRELKKIIIAWSLVMAAISVIIFFTKTGHAYSRAWWGLWYGVGMIGLLLTHTTMRWALRQLRRKGYGLRSIIVIGYPDLSASLANRLHQTPSLGLDVQQIFDPNEVELSEVSKFIQSEKIDQVWIALPLKEEHLLNRILDQLAQIPVEIKYVPDLFGLRLFSHSFMEINGLPVVNLCSSPIYGMNAALKASEDRILSVFFLVLLTPLMLCIAAAIKMTSHGPVFFAQDRHGLNGRKIKVLKFRSMVVHQESEGVVTQATKTDVRITPIGRFLRKTSLDELPQFINVLRGDMSIVGPRPHAIAHNLYYQTLVEGYMDRHRVKPGITGWAQVNGYRGETDTVEKMQNRVEYDLYYIENWSIWFDVKIILLTIYKGFTGSNAY